MNTLNVNVKKRLKTENEPRKATFTFTFPESVQEAIEMYGEETSLKLLHEAITLDVQAPARKVLEASPSGLSSEEYSSIVMDHMKDWKIEAKRTRGTTGPRISAFQSIVNDLSNPEKAQELIEKFRSLGIELNPNGASVEEVATATSSRRR
jgi:hypothetical protein